MKAKTALLETFGLPKDVNFIHNPSICNKYFVYFLLITNTFFLGNNI
jgi:hypothetical protein